MTGLVVGIDRGGNRIALKEHGADWVVKGLEAVSWEGLLAWFSEVKLPSALAEFGSLKQEAAGQQLGIFLDYDGTLAEIAPRPELAVLAPYGLEALRAVAQVHPTFIISGRDLADVRNLVGIPELYYAGSHGYQIEGPDFQYQFDPALAPLINQVGLSLKVLEQEIPGCLVEIKSYAVAVHYRLVAPDLVPQIRERVEAALAGTLGLKLAEGKMVFEIRPDRDWDKGKALEYLLELFLPRLGEIYPLYIGDDTTDEDAFRAVAGWGIGILVSEWPRATLARYLLQDPFEVAEFLGRLGAL
jgi:trehalose-phosphatase